MKLVSDQMYVNLPVADVAKTRAFFANLGFEFHPQFSNDEAICMIVGPNSFVMLLNKGMFSQFTKKTISDASQSTEVIIALGASSREAVDGFMELVVSNGGTETSEPMDHGFMYQRSFADLDCHQWEIGWMDFEEFMKRKES